MEERRVERSESSVPRVELFQVASQLLLPRLAVTEFLPELLRAVGCLQEEREEAAELQLKVQEIICSHVHLFVFLEALFEGPLQVVLHDSRLDAVPEGLQSVRLEVLLEVIEGLPGQAQPLEFEEGRFGEVVHKF